MRYEKVCRVQFTVRCSPFRNVLPLGNYRIISTTGMSVRCFRSLLGKWLFSKLIYLGFFFFFFLCKWVFVTNRLLFSPAWVFSVTLCLTLPPLGLVIRAFDHNLVTLCVCNVCACACACMCVAASLSHISKSYRTKLLLFFFFKYQAGEIREEGERIYLGGGGAKKGKQVINCHTVFTNSNYWWS